MSFSSESSELSSTDLNALDSMLRIQPPGSPMPSEDDEGGDRSDSDTPSLRSSELEELERRMELKDSSIHSPSLSPFNRRTCFQDSSSDVDTVSSPDDQSSCSSQLQDSDLKELEHVIQWSGENFEDSTDDSSVENPSSHSEFRDLSMSPPNSPHDQSGPGTLRRVDVDKLVLYQLEPTRLEYTYEELSTLKDRIWAGGVVLDYWLINLWIKLGRPEIQYIPTDYLLPFARQPSDEQIKRYRGMFGLPDIESGPCPLAPKIGLLNTGGSKDRGGNHYCCIAFLPAEHEIHILGRSIAGHERVQKAIDHWKEWGGPNVWSNVAALHGWAETEIEVREVHWPQNGYDCGPTSCQVVEQIWTTGFRLDRKRTWIMPPLPCSHSIRIRMAYDIRRAIFESLEQYQHLRIHNPGILERNLMGPRDEDGNRFAQVRKMIEGNISVSVTTVTSSNKVAMLFCPGCKRVIGSGPWSENHSQDHPVKTRTKLANIPCLRGSRLMIMTGEKGSGHQTDSRSVVADEEASWETTKFDKKDRSSTESESGTPLVNKLLNPARRNKPYHVKDYTQATLGRFPRPIRPPLLPPRQTLRGLRLPFDYKFDDYEQGGTIEDLEPIPDTITLLASATLAYVANRITTLPWETFKDYGWRIAPDFFQAFDMQEPIMVNEHTMPSGKLKKCRTDKMEPNFNDVAIMGAKEMIREGDLFGNQDIFLKGLTRDGRLVCVDLGRDSVALDKQEIMMSCDLDSFVWVTKQPKFKGVVDVFVAPVIRDRAPIWKHNHIYVDLVVPQSMEDREALGPRTEWWTKKLRLSRVPHVAFGKLGGGSSTVNLLLFFPRMADQAPYSGRWVSLVPSTLQNVLWDRIINPAMRRVTNSLDRPYVGLEREHVEFKQGRGRKEKAPIAYPFREETFEGLIGAIEEQIKSCGDELSQFGSHFYVAEMKGCKGYTKVLSDQCLQSSMESSIGHFRKEFSYLDWEYMQDPTKGEFVCDIGITLHPKSETPLVGLWKLDSLEASFGAGGFLQGNLHRLNTLSMYGGLQAEQREERAKRSQVVFRSAYNLAYEVTRKVNNKRDLFQEKELYRMTATYKDDCEKVISLYRGKASNESYGVRDEFRIGGRALEKFTGAIDQMVVERIEAKSIEWLPSKLWFEFEARRLEVLRDTHKILYERQPDNIGILTGLWAYLMQSVLFTPTMVNGYVRESLNLLRQRQVVDRFGMFFLQELDMEKKDCLKGVLEVDDIGVLKALGGSLEKRKEKMPGMTEEEGFPLGRTPSWKEVKEAIRDSPWTIMRGWSWPEELEETMRGGSESAAKIAGGIFSQFTTHIWVALGMEWKTEGEEDVLAMNASEGVEAWRLERVYGRIRSCGFMACNGGLNGAIPGTREPRFEERVELYFPERGVELKNMWKHLGSDPGYLGEYWWKMERLDEERREEVKSWLGLLLKHCQCLPASTSQQPWRVKGLKVMVVTNPRYYRLDFITKSGSGGRRKRRAATHVGARALKERILELQGIRKEVARAAVRVQKSAGKRWRSGKSLNKRKPPVRKKIEDLEEEESEEEFETKEKDEGDMDDDGDDDEDDDEEEDEEEDDNQEDGADEDLEDDLG